MGVEEGGREREKGEKWSKQQRNYSHAIKWNCDQGKEKADLTGPKGRQRKKRGAHHRRGSITQQESRRISRLWNPITPTPGSEQGPRADGDSNNTRTA
jgi:hypothetical protein